MADLDKIMTALRNAHNAGDTASAQRLAEMARQARAVSGNPQPAPALYTPQNAGMFTQAPQSAAVNPMNPVQGDPTAITRVVDNVVGLDNGVMSAGEQAAAALNKGGESLTLGVVGDEAAGKFDEMIGRRAAGTGTEFYRQQERDLKDANAPLALAAEVGPAFIPGVGAVGAVARGATTAARVGRSALLGAGAAGLYGGMEGEGGLSDRLMNAGAAALFGGVAGAAAPKVTEVLTGLPRGLKRLFNRVEQRPDTSVLKATKNAAYRAVEEAGETFDGDSMTALSTRIKNTLADDVSYVPGEDTALDATIRMFERREGQQTTLSQLDRMRQGLWRRVRNSPDQVQIYDAIEAVDDAIASRADTSELMAAARLANSQYSKTQLLEDAFTKATDQTASTGSGGNILNKYRQAVTSIINNPRKARFFTDAEIDTMRNFVRGDMPENFMRRVGKLSPNGNGLMMALHTYGAIASSGVTLPLMAVGAGAKAAADRRVTRGADALLDMTAGVRRPGLPVVSPNGAAAGVAVSGLSADAGNEARNMLRSVR